MTRKACAECTLSNSILERGLPGRNLYSLEPAAPVVRRKLTNTGRAIARQVPAALVANRRNGTDSLGHMTKDDLVFWVSLFGFVASNVAFLVWLLVQ